MVICKLACGLCVNSIHFVAWSCEWWMHESQTSSSLARGRWTFGFHYLVR